ncbi:hypothetical protein PoB_000783000 [Plakobranchus ocellatus]|uniref:Uncharacterized protein n=1 Tax=Plakobranchus ocellatus TaxID=259542 RepID=A0AAV3YFR4_9GAST|nr:hypothetical protein PoB_000783000 [Plakobranchus ocellatus]
MAKLPDSKQECHGIPHLQEKFSSFFPAIAPPKKHLLFFESHGPCNPQTASEVAQTKRNMDIWQTSCPYRKRSSSRRESTVLTSYHALQRSDDGAPRTIIRLMPLFYENSHSIALIKIPWTW